MPDRMKDRSPTRLATHAALLIFGIVLGSGIAWALMSGWLKHDNLETALKWAGLGLLVLIPVTGLTALVVLWALKRFWGRFSGTLEASIEHGARSLQASAAARPGEAIDHFKNAVQEAAAWYAPIAARRFVVQSTLALLVAIGGLVGTALLFQQIELLAEQNRKLGRQTTLLERQNKSIEDQTKLIGKQTELLVSQNEKTDLQIVTAEAQRRADLTNAVFDALRQVAEYSEKPDAKRETPEYCSKLLSQPYYKRRMDSKSYVNIDKFCKRKLLILPNALISHVKSISGRATPYYTIHTQIIDGKLLITNSDKKFSPQRGQLLIGLAGLNVSFKHLDADFSFSDLKMQKIENFDLSYIDMSNSDLSESIIRNNLFFHSSIDNSDFSKSTIQLTSFVSTNCRNCNFSNTRLSMLINGHTSSAQLYRNTNNTIFFSNMRLSNFNKTYIKDIILDITDLNSTEKYDFIVKNNKKYFFEVDFLQHIENINLAFIPNQWRVAGKRARKRSSRDSINFGDTEVHNDEWIIETPWGDYADLIDEQHRNGFIDLYARQMTMQSKQQSIAIPNGATP